jgi:hypothetical protein
LAATLPFAAPPTVAQTSERGPVRGAEHVLPPVAPWGLAPGDFDQDGDLDLLHTSLLDAHVLRNDGFGRFRVENSFFHRPPSATATFGPAFSGDFDGDGVSDVGVHYRPLSGGSKIKFFRGSPGGLLPVALEANGPIGNSPALVDDFDGDGDPDVLFSGGGFVTLIRNAGAFAFSATATPFPVGVESVADASDFDGDGDVDLLARTTAAAGPGARVLLNSGTGSFGTWLAVPSSQPNVRFVRTGPGAAAVLQSSVDAAGLAQDVRYELVGGAAIAVATFGRPTAAVVADAADFDGDGVDELVRADAPTIEIGPLGPGSSFVSRSAGPPLPNHPYFVRPFDVDGDGDRDLPFHDPARGSRLLRRRIDGTYGEAEPGPAFPPPPSGVRFFPIDAEGDGDVDLALCEPTAPLRFAFNDGRGNFAVGPPAGPAIPPVGTGLRFDVEADGDEDLVVVGLGGLARVRNDGSSGWTVDVAPRTHAAPASFVAARASDLDADGDVDVVALFRDDADRVLVYRNDAGTFAPPAAHLGASAFAQDLAVADVDLDGDLDLAVAEATYGAGGVSGLQNVVPRPSWALLNVGACTFVPQPLPPQYYGFSADVGDIDGDGDDDVVFGDVVYRREPWGYAFHGLFSNNAEAQQRRLADLDGDGLLDMVSGRFRAKGLGGGVFGVETVTTPRPEKSGTPWWVLILPGSFSTADLDRDGDLDLVGSTLWPFGPLWNYDRGLQRAAPAFVGGVAGIEVFAPGGTPYFLAAAVDALPGGATVPGWGTLHLDPATAFVVAGGATDASGLGAVPLGVPNDPGLVGLSLHWQAAFPTLPRLSNHRLLTILAPF